MIYLLEDDFSIRKFVIYALERVGYKAKGFSAPSQLYSELKNQLPQLILLDIMLPEEDGLTVLKKLKDDKKTSTLPVIMLTAKGSEYDKVTGLDLGADDYIPKPFGAMELVARIKAVLRRSGSITPNEEYSLGDLVVNPTKHTALVKGEQITLTLKEFELLRLLIKNRGTVFSRDRLLKEVWDYSAPVESRTVDVHIKTLRSKLKDCGHLIETVRGLGYKIGD